MSEIDPVILGHNQFIGVSHLSQEAARSRVEQFSELTKIAEVITFAKETGVNGIMLSTHPRIKDILKYMERQGWKDMNFYPLIPYAQGYVRRLNEKGPLGLLNEVLKPAGIPGVTKLIFKGSMGLLTRDLYKLLGTLIDIELLPFQGFKVKAVFLHNILTDLALASGVKHIFQFFINYVKEKYNATPGFATMNFARLVKTLNEWGVYRPLVMASFNEVGFQMNPSREECERCLKEYNVDLLAMSTLAAGYLKPKKAYEYLFSLPNMKSVVVGVSTKEHAAETFSILREHLASEELKSISQT